MTIQSIGSIYQSQKSMRSDFRNLAQSLKAYQNAQNSGNQDQVTLSQNALIQAAGQVQQDIAGVTTGQSTGGTSQIQNSGKIQNLQNDLQALQTALNSTSQGQGTSTQNSVAEAMTNVANDLSSFQKAHGHHGHSYNMVNAANSGNSSNNDSISSLASLFGVGSGSLQNSLNTLNITA